MFHGIMKSYVVACYQIYICVVYVQLVVQGEWMRAMASSCAESTMKKRTTCWRHWLRFLRMSGYSIPPIRPSELHVCLFIIWLFRKKYAYHTVRTYLYSLAAELKFRGGIDIVKADRSWFVHSTMRHFKKKLGTAPIVYRRPLTIDLLERLLIQLDLSQFDNYVYATMLVVGVYCLLRIGELCYTKCKNSYKFIKNSDLSFNSTNIEFTLWSTKTDQEIKGVKKWITNVPKAEFNPFTMMQRLKAMKCSSSEKSKPFFALNNGNPVTRNLLVSFLQREMKRLFPKIDAKEWNGISLRKGGATSALRAGIAGEIIQVMGNWKSDAYKSYIDHSFQDVMTAQNLMATMDTRKDGGVS
jgi:integrase